MVECKALQDLGPVPSMSLKEMMTQREQGPDPVEPYILLGETGAIKNFEWNIDMI